MKKFVIILLILLLIGMILILFFRPGSKANTDEPPDFVKLIGSLAPHRDVTAKDMAGRNCWNDEGVLAVPAGGTCSMRFPEKVDRLKICLDSGLLLALEIQGDKYGPQKFGQDKIGCGAGGQSFDLYDDNSRLAAVCGPTAPCVLRLNN